jgi:hypothetical protein
LKALARLPGTSTEIRALGQLFDAGDSNLFLGERATETNLRSAQLANVRVLALATHGLVAGELSGISEPGLVLTPPETANASDDGFLTASEVAGHDLNAEWVTLSACSTAAGDPRRCQPRQRFRHAGPSQCLGAVHADRRSLTLSSPATLLPHRPFQIFGEHKNVGWLTQCSGSAAQTSSADQIDTS